MDALDAVQCGGRVIEGPRSQLDQLSKREEVRRTGVYLLVGSDPDDPSRALASIDVDISSIEEGQAITVKWRGKPVFVRNRTAKEIEEAKAVPLEELKDPSAENANLEPGAPATVENRSGGEGKDADIGSWQ